MGYSTENSGITNNNNGFSYSNWVIPIRSPLKPINTTTGSTAAEDERETTSSTSSLSVPTTPTTEASKIPSKLPCPPPPRKRKPSPTAPAAAGNGHMRCKNNSSSSSNSNKLCNNGRREFFITPPDLEAVFVRRHNVGC